MRKSGPHRWHVICLRRHTAGVKNGRQSLPVQCSCWPMTVIKKHWSKYKDRKKVQGVILASTQQKPEASKLCQYASTTSHLSTNQTFPNQPKKGIQVVSFRLQRVAEESFEFKIFLVQFLTAIDAFKRSPVRTNLISKHQSRSDYCQLVLFELIKLSSQSWKQYQEFKWSLQMSQVTSSKVYHFFLIPHRV